MTRFLHMRSTSRLPYQQGLSLVEIMISITLSLLIIAGIIQLFVNSRGAAVTEQGISRIQENFRYTMQRLERDIYRAGNMGCFSFSAVGLPAAPSAGDPTAGGSPQVKNQFIFNRLDDNTPPTWNIGIVGGILVFPNADGSWQDFESSFISSQNDTGLNGSDTLMVKYADVNAGFSIDSIVSNTALNVSHLVGQTVADVGDVVYAGNCKRVYVFHVGNIVTLGSGTTSTVTMRTAAIPTLTHDISIDNEEGFLYAGDSGAHEYFIGTSAAVAAPAVCAAATPQNCSLFRRSNGEAAQELVLGVSDLQVSYGYEGDANLYSAFALTLPGGNGGRLTPDRLTVTLTFNAPDGTQAGGVVSRTMTRVFAIRNQL